MKKILSGVKKFSSNISCEEKSSLRLAMVYFRHGRRTPILKKIEVAEAEWPLEWVENDLPHTMFDYKIKNANLEPKTLDTSLFDQSYATFGVFKGGAGHGLLTKFGQEDAFNLGQRLRKRYIDGEKLVPSYYSADHVKLYTTFIKRTVKSMRCVLAGMFDKEGSHVADIYSRPVDFEYYFPNFEYCLRYKMICREALRREKEASHLAFNRQKLAEIMGKKRR
uniref:Lysophosphatidic acid phosphatase type 6 (Trinotate prediction) n=1 Tax=Myxobolus squamalis TaxID=59785 RepID=A0A6B2G8G3_MYXSQ